MKTILGLKNFDAKKFKQPIAVAIGTFDGVHLAHKQIIKKAVKCGAKGTSVVLTFYPHPMRITNPASSPALLTSIDHRIRLISEIKPDVCLIVKFQKRFSMMPPEKFIKTILVDKLSAARVTVGDGFSFGRNRTGNAKYLKICGEKFGFLVDVLKPIKKNKKIISSTLIRNFIESGKLGIAEKFLDRRFSVLGTVIKGDSRGRVLGYPTANIDPHQEALPPAGVYAVRAKIKKKWYGGMVYVGHRPTFYNKSGKLTVEANIFNFKKIIYGMNLEVFFIKKLRADKKFRTADALKKQLEKDKTDALAAVSVIKK